MPTPRSGLLVATALVAGALLIAAAISGCGSTTHSSTSVSAAKGRPGPESIFEPKEPLFSDPASTLDLMRRLGVDRVKVFVAWNGLAPDSSSRARPRFDAASPAGYPASVWAPYDAIARDAEARGIALYFAVGGLAPLWATSRHPAPGGPYNGAQWEPSPAQFGLFVRAVATRYSGHYTPPGDSSPLPRISFWSIWNEPNLGSADLAPQAIDHSKVEASPAMYRRLVDAAWSALHATGHGGDTILIGELAPYGQVGGNSPGDYGEMVPLRFARALYCVDASDQPLRGAAAAARGCPTTAAASKAFPADNPGLFQASGFAVHPYPSGAVPPNVVLTNGPGFVNLASLPRLAQLLDKVTSLYGASRQFPFYVTEYGYFTNPPYQGGAPLATAAANLNQAEYIAWRNPRIRSWDQYLLLDPAPGPSNFVTGLEFANGTHKPTFAAYRMPLFLPVTHASAGHALEVWGCVRPAHYAQLGSGRTQQVRIELRARAGGPFKAVREVSITNQNGYFDVGVSFPSSGTVRLAWSYPHGPTIYSRPVPISIS